MNPKYPRKFEKPAMVGVSMSHALKQLVKERAVEHNDQGKMSPYLVELIERDLLKDPRPGTTAAIRDAVEFLNHFEGSRSEIIENLENCIEAYSV